MARLASLALFSILLAGINCTVYIVQDDGKPDKDRVGSLTKPYKTIQDCVNVLKKGDECRIRAGRYHEYVKIDNLHGTEDEPIIIGGYRDEIPIIDGTVLLKPLTPWTPYKVGSGIYKTKIMNKIWQLFFNGQMMTNARWPNAKWSDKSIFNGSKWAKTDGKNKKPLSLRGKDNPKSTKTHKIGLIYDKDNKLASENIDATGAMAIMNIGSFLTFVAHVKNHKAGQGHFEFDDTFGDYSFNAAKSIYFLEDKLNLLDTKEEWFYNHTTQMLYLITPDGSKPKLTDQLRGKDQTYAFEISGCSHLVLKDMNFFATTINAENAKGKTNNGIRFDSLNFEYPSYSKRMLGHKSLIEKMKIGNSEKQRKKDGTLRKMYELGKGNFVFYNNKFYGSDGFLAFVNGYNVTFDNNKFEYNDWSCANTDKNMGGIGLFRSMSQNEYYIRNTLFHNGAKAGLQPGLNPVVKYNRIFEQCKGVLQNDGAAIQVKIKSQKNSILSHNWAYNSPKFGMRFDGPDPPVRQGELGTMDHNVALYTNGIMVKGKQHIVKQNLAFQKRTSKSEDSQSDGCVLCILKYLRKDTRQLNIGTYVEGNVADEGNGGKNMLDPTQPDPWPVAGDVVKGKNIFDADIDKQFVDANNFDFRPMKDSEVAKKGLGPHKYEEKMREYWIPGSQSEKALYPVPREDSENVMAERRNALMWLPALDFPNRKKLENAEDCQTHSVYFGETESSLNYLGETTNGDNVFYLNGMNAKNQVKVEKGKTYYWRVDSACDFDNVGKINKGHVWKFTTI